MNQNMHFQGISQNVQNPAFRGISGSTLKLIAIITMLIDHTGATVLRAILQHPAVAGNPELRNFWQMIYNNSRSIGRLAFPIFCFLLVEGFIHTRNAWKYAARLFLFALISEIPFDIALKGNWYFPAKQNVYFTLLIGLLVMIGISFCERIAASGIRFAKSEINDATGNTPARSLLRIFTCILCVILAVLIILAGMRIARDIDTDYNYKGVFLIAAMYLTRKFRLLQCITGAIAISWESMAPLSFIPVYFYNGTRGRQMKYVFYWFYPVHLLVLHVIAKYIIPII